MPLRKYKNIQTGEIVETLKNLSKNPDYEVVLEAPNQKFMVTANAATGKSKLKDSEGMLKARARNYSRDVHLDENIQRNRMNGLDSQVAQNFLNEKGERRKKIDDL